MGYTHYLSDQKPATDEQWDELTEFAYDMLLTAMKNEDVIVNSFGNVNTFPEVSDEAIAFNGILDFGHESCVIEKNGSGFNFCKTNRKSYDKYVVALFYAASLIGLGEFTSDGYPEELEEGIALVDGIFRQNI